MIIAPVSPRAQTADMPQTRVALLPGRVTKDRSSPLHLDDSIPRVCPRQEPRDSSLPGHMITTTTTQHHRGHIMITIVIRHQIIRLCHTNRVRCHITRVRNLTTSMVVLITMVPCHITRENIHMVKTRCRLTKVICHITTDSSRITRFR